MRVPFTWKVTGWFMIGWSPEFPSGEVLPLHYFGQDLVAYRWPRTPGDTRDVPEGRLRDLIERQFLSTDFDDLEIWQQFYDVPATEPA